MIRPFQKVFLLALAVAGVAGSASGFSMLGLVESWQTSDLGYNTPPMLGFTDIGGPMNLGEEYRWNERTITYGFDKSFVDYFGQKGVSEVNKAVAILNNLPPCSSMSANLSEFPTDSKRINYQAGGVLLRDLKSVALSTLVEQMGLASPERYVWCIRHRVVLPSNTATNYLVIMRNFDPTTLYPSKYVNNILYTYDVVEFPTPYNFSDALERSVDPFASFNSVASVADNVIGEDPFGGLISGQLTTLRAGEFFTGLTRDDIGGLRYLYAAKGPYRQVNAETLIPGTVGGSLRGLSPWLPAGGGGGTNVAVDLAPRAGVDKILFKQVTAPFGIFNGSLVTNTYTDTFFIGSQLFRQVVQRVSLTGPDILFAAADLATLDPADIPNLYARTFGPIDNAALNGGGSTPLAGPGEMLPPVVITLSKGGPWFRNQFPSFLSEMNSPQEDGWVWGSFDGTTNAPFIYPAGPNGKGTPLAVLLQQVLN